MTHHLPQTCRSTQKPASKLRTLDPSGDNPLSVPHHGPSSAGPGKTKLSYPNVQQPCSRSHSASDGKRWTLPNMQPCHNMFHYRAVKTSPNQGSITGGQHLELCNLCNHSIKASAVSTQCLNGNVTEEILSNTMPNEVQRGGMLTGGTAGICSPCPCVPAAVSMSRSSGRAGQESSKRDLA